MNDYRIFIVEDEAIVAADLAETLVSLGYRVAGTARSGESAVEKITGLHPDLVLMDIHLDGKMDGVDAAGEIHRTSDIPIVFLTAYADNELLERAKHTEPYGYLIKPYDDRELRSVIEMARYKYGMDRKLRESEEKYRALTENTPDILFSTDMAGNITYISPRINKYGFLEEEVIGKSLRVLIHPAEIDQVEDHQLRELEQGAQFVSQFRVLDKWGTTWWFEEKSFLRLDISGKPVGIYGILHDVTERKRAEDAIELANKKLNLMNNITRHDILNTITGLLGCVDMAKAAGSSEEREQLLSDIRDLTRVIQRQIAFTREYQEVGVHLPLWQDIVGVVSRVLQNFEAASPEILVELEHMEVYADPLLEKVFYNLVDNAIRYGERITTIRFSSEGTESGLSIICEDDGAGIPCEEKQRIFERGVGKNTGMGLFLTQEILGITGISIVENGVYGEGARFEIHIPRGTYRPVC
jgi:PAS domain S-box-containing protein